LNTAQKEREEKEEKNAKDADTHAKKNDGMDTTVV
jgi:hypothetical protein